jgi:hypothetical protein
MAGSTLKGEEEPVIRAFNRLRTTPGGQGALLVIAARHPERFDEVERLCRQEGLSTTRRTELPIDAEHRHTVDDGPDESRHRDRVVRANNPVPLQNHERIDEGLKGAGAFSGQLRLRCDRVHEAAEHHAIVRRVRHREPDVRHAHGREGRLAAAPFLPRTDEFEAQHAKAFGRDRGEQRPLVGKMPVERRAGDASLGADLPQRQPLDAVGPNHGQRLVEEAAAQIAMVVRAGLSSCARSGHVTSSYGEVLTAST